MTNRALLILCQTGEINFVVSSLKHRRASRDTIVRDEASLDEFIDVQYPSKSYLQFSTLRSSALKVV